MPDHLTCLLCAGQEATVRTGHGTMDWFQIGKGVHQVYILSPCLFKLYAEWVKISQSCPTLWNPMDYTIHGMLQARILEWVASSFSRGSSRPRDRTQLSLIVGRHFTIWATREVRRQAKWSGIPTSKNFPQFVVIHRVKDFSVVSEAEVDIFLEFPGFLYDVMNVSNLILGSSAFSKSSLNIWKFTVHVL